MHFLDQMNHRPGGIHERSEDKMKLDSYLPNQFHVLSPSTLKLATLGPQIDYKVKCISIDQVGKTEEKCPASPCEEGVMATKRIGGGESGMRSE